ncbi:MAG: histone deacetylase [Candidatus Aminicenantes bacterium]|nr:histone deacetylase [Candidatus Aminicenantes bacterium]
MSRTGLVYHPDYLKHNPGGGHPENPQRLQSIIEHLKKVSLWTQLVHIEPAMAAEELLELVHTKEHIERVRRTSQQGFGCLDMGDTLVSKLSFAVARLAVGGVLKAVDAVMEGTLDNAFAAIRPPGHHAERDHAMGFCLFNNVAIAARYLQQNWNLKRVLIVDWDVHHGNGTQHIFEEDPTVLYFSTHQYPYYPGTGSAAEKGKGRGEGYTLNIPLAYGSDEEDYLRAFQTELLPAALSFRPDFILISAGFDAHKDDPLAGMRLTESSYYQFTRIIKNIASDTCQGRIISLLEGGYNLISLSRSLESHLKALIEDEGTR